MIDERFSLKEFNIRGPETPEARNLAEELEKEILQGAHKVVGDSMSEIVNRLKSVGFDLSANSPKSDQNHLDQGWTTKLDDRTLSVTVDLSVICGFADLNKEVEWGHESIPQDSKLYSTVAPLALKIRDYVCEQNFSELDFYIRDFILEQNLRDSNSALYKYLYDPEWMKSVGKGGKGVKEFFDSCEKVEIALEKMFAYNTGRHCRMNDRMGNDLLVVRAYYFDTSNVDFSLPLKENQKKGVDYLTNDFIRFEDGWVLKQKLF